MDKIKAKELERTLKGTTLSGYEIIELINNGKSAAVFKAKKETEFFALKIFDNELVERFGHEIQVKRIEQEIALKNHSVKNLVKIYEGGNTILENQTYYYIVMELISGENLKDFIISQDYGQDFIITVFKSLINTTEQLLEQENIVHRDIKPENIMVTADRNIILMDLGVLKLVGAKSFSDEEEKSFVGTLRYAAPEFLLRTEEDSTIGWRSVNLYQIGATLHDLIMKRELFDDKTPYTNLVIAIKEDTPKVSNPQFSFELLQVTRDLMTKDWKKRLQLNPKERLSKVFLISEIIENQFEQSIDEILKMRLTHQAKFDEIEKLQRTKTEIRDKQKKFALNLSQEIDKCFETIKNKGVCSSLAKSQKFTFDNDRNSDGILIQNYLYELGGELKMGYPRSPFIFVRLSNDEINFTEIEVLGIFPSPFLKADTKNPHILFQEYAKTQQRFNPHSIHTNLNTINIFKGVVDFDESFNTHLSNQIVKLIAKSLKLVEKTVTEELQWREEIAKSNKPINSRVITGSNTIIIDRL
jgi:serine/threonine protein kinase